jgi:hypothetical protein
MARAITLIAASAAAIALLIAPGQAATPGAQATCGNKSASLLFWPNGHGARPDAGFPKFKKPHLEVYGGLHRDTFPKNLNAYADPGTATVSNNACNTQSPEPLSGKVPNSGKRTKATNFQCRFGQKMIVAFTQVNGGIKVTVVRNDGTKVIELKILNSGSSAVYNKERCEAKAPPD